MKNAPEHPEYLKEIPNHTEIKLRPFYHTDLKNTLENIVFTDKPKKAFLKKYFLIKVKLKKLQ